jgi:hypothetical protein
VTSLNVLNLCMLLLLLLLLLFLQWVAADTANAQCAEF